MDADEALTRGWNLDMDDAGGEHVVCAVQASTRRWYTPITGSLSRWEYSGEHYWWLVLTDTRVFILPRKEDADGNRDSLKLQAPRSEVEVEVERFKRTGIASWRLVLDLGTEGRWSLHSLTALFGCLPLAGSTLGKARQIAESLGWKPSGQR
jgi:hypothetical protein